jgi:hypothetical protein
MQRISSSTYPSTERNEVPRLFVPPEIHGKSQRLVPIKVVRCATQCASEDPVFATTYACEIPCASLTMDLPVPDQTCSALLLVLSASPSTLG